MTEQQQITFAYLDAIQDAFNRHDVDAILSYFADDCEWFMARGPNAPEGRRCVGKQEIGAVLRARYEIIQDMRWVNMKHWIVDHSKALSEWNVQGTLANGDRFDYMGCDLWEFRNGLVTKKDTYWKFVES